MDMRNWIIKTKLANHQPQMQGIMLAWTEYGDFFILNDY